MEPGQNTAENRWERGEKTTKKALWRRKPGRNNRETLGGPRLLKTLLLWNGTEKKRKVQKQRCVVTKTLADVVVEQV